MAGGDSLREILELARRELPEVPPEVWERFEGLVRLHYGTERIYIAARKKARHLDAIAQADETADAGRLAQMLGLSVRQAQRLKRLR